MDLCSGMSVTQCKAGFDKFWRDLMRFDKIWQDLIRFNKIQGDLEDLARFCESLRDSVIF